MKIKNHIYCAGCLAFDKTGPIEFIKVKCLLGYKIVGVDDDGLFGPDEPCPKPYKWKTFLRYKKEKYNL